MVKIKNFKRILGIIVIIGLCLFYLGVYLALFYGFQFYTQFFFIVIFTLICIIYFFYRAVQPRNFPFHNYSFILGFNQSWISSPKKRHLFYEIIDDGVWRNFGKSDLKITLKSLIIFIISIIGIVLIILSPILQQSLIYSENTYTPKKVNEIFNSPVGRLIELEYGEEYGVVGKIKSIEYTEKYIFNPIKYDINITNPFSNYKTVTVIVLEEDYNDPIEYIHDEDLTEKFKKGDRVKLIFTSDDNRGSLGSIVHIKRVELISNDIPFILIFFGLILHTIIIMDIIITDWIMIRIIEKKRIKYRKNRE